MNFYDLYPNFDESKKLLIQAISQFVEQEIAPLADEIDKSNEFPSHLWQKMGDMGCLGVTVSEEDGGMGLGYLDHVIVMALISQGSGSIGLSYGAHSNLCVNQIARNGNKKQKQHYLPNLISGKWVGALAMSETGAGSDVVGMKLKATEDSNGDFILNGHKMWITNGPDASVVIVYAKTNEEKKSRGITAFIVDKNCKGWSHAQKLDKLGMRGSNTCELLFKDCIVPRENILGEVDQGVEVLMSGLDFERIVLAGGPIGIMQSCMNLVLPYLRERKQFKQPIGDFQLMQGKIADMYTRFSAACALVFNIANNFDHKQVTRYDASAAILFASEQATQMALEAIQCLGGNGYTNEYPAGRYLRDAKLYEIGAGTNEIRRMLIGKEILRQKTYNS